MSVDILNNDKFSVLKTLYVSDLMHYIVYDKIRDCYIMVCFGHNRFDLQELESYVYGNKNDFDFDSIENNESYSEFEKDKALIGIIEEMDSKNIGDHIYNILSIVEFDSLNDVPSIAMDINDSLVSIDFDDEDSSQIMFIKGVMNVRLNKTIDELNEADNYSEISLLNLKIIQHGISVGGLLRLKVSFDDLSNSPEFCNGNAFEFITYNKNEKEINSYKIDRLTIDKITPSNWYNSVFSTTIVNCDITYDGIIKESIDKVKDFNPNKSYASGDDFNLIAAQQWQLEEN